MATPTYTTVLDQINAYIVANGSNDITANVLNPILQYLLNFSNNNIGDLSTLTTSENNSVVESINSLKDLFENLTNNGVQLHTGINDPNSTPPIAYNYADFYMQLDVDDLPVKLWQWNGFEWADTSKNSDILLNQYSSTPSDWAAQSYASGLVVFYGGKQWLSKESTVAGDVPSVSSKWEEVTFEALAGKKPTIYKDGQLCVFKNPSNENESILEVGDMVTGIVEGMFINASYLGGDTTLLASFNIVNQTEV